MNNRINNLLPQQPTQPPSPAAAIAPGFAICPMLPGPALAGGIHQAAYQQALEESRNRAWRAFLDRALFSVWN